MNYSETLKYLFNRLPMFHRIGAAAYKADLKNIQALSELLHHPEKKFRSVHIAGTNGKGSVSSMLASVFQEAGYKTGLFTSPHLKDFRERIRIDGRMIGEETVMRFVEEYKQQFESIQPSFFEWTTALAFQFFAEEQVDVAIIETGLGGRLDSTNIISPELSVITNISYDHMQLLGDTLEKIAVEKAGIIKKNVPVVIGEKQEESEGVFIQRANEMQAPLTFASEKFKAEFLSSSEAEQQFRILSEGRILYDNLSLELRGNYQAKNSVTVLQSLEIVRKNFPEINEEAIRRGFKNVNVNTGLQGRWQILNRNPLTIADVAHNEAGIRFVMEQLEEVLKAEAESQSSKVKSQKVEVKGQRLKVKHDEPGTKRTGHLHIVFGLVNDKNPSSVLSLLPKDAFYYFCQANIPRALDAGELKNAATGFQLSGESFSSVGEAFHAAQSRAEEGDIVFVGGSTFVVAEVV